MTDDEPEQQGGEPQEPMPHGSTDTGAALSELDRALNALKPVAQPADTPHVVAPGSDPRMAWDTVIDREPEVVRDVPASPPAPAAPSFQFDLGSALSMRSDEASSPVSADRVGVPIDSTLPSVVRAEPVVPPLDVRRPAETTDERRVHVPPAGVAPLEMRRPTEVGQPDAVPAMPARDQVLRAEPTHQPEQRVASANTATSPAPQPAAVEPLPVLERRTPLESRDEAAPRRTVFDDEASGAARAALHRVPTGSSIAEAAGVKVALPSLPATAPATASAVPFEPNLVSAPTVSDVRAYRMAQQRAAKRSGQGRLFGRVFLVIIGLGGLIGAALLFGRSYLFPTEWDPALTPLVDEIQVARGEDFVEPIDLVVQPEAEFVATFGAQFVPGGWVEQMPEWRALGIAGGSPTAESLVLAVASAQPAIFDPESGTIRQLADADPVAVEVALRAALEQAFDAQRDGARSSAAGATSESTDDADVPLANGFLGVSSHESLVDRSLRAVLNSSGGPQVAAAATLPDTVSVPLPVAYEIAAMKRIGPAVAAASADRGVILTPGGDHPDDVYSVFAPPGALATLGAVLGEGETLSEPAVALSGDDWRLVLGAQLDPAAADSAVAATTANSYATFERGGRACFAAVFQFNDPATALSGIEGVTAWAAALPVASQAVATPLDFTTLQVVACDPGDAESNVVDTGWVDGVIDGQLARL